MVKTWSVSFEPRRPDVKVSLLDLGAIHTPIHAQLMEAMENVVKSQHFILGPEVEKLESKLAAYCGTKFAVGVSSGTDALLASLMALNLQAGDEVITTPYSFFATAGAIARLGLRPVFVDIDPETYNLDPALVPSAITVKTRAIVPVHLFGQCADIEPLLRLAGQHHLSVIEDAAQAIGSAYRDGRRAGGLGDMGCFSFFPSKNLGAFGDGGLVTTQNEELYKRLLSLRVHGAQSKYYHRYIGGNFRLDALQAAVLNVKLAYLDLWTEQRRQNAQRYIKLFKDSGLLSAELIRLPTALYNDSLRYPHIYNQFVIRARQRDDLLTCLKGNGISTEVYYPLPLHLQECFKYLGYSSGQFVHSEKAAQETLALPVYPGLTPVQQEYIVDTIQAFYKTSKR